jgi:sugar phosphate permease
LLADCLDATVGPAVLLRAGLCIETACQLVLALTRSAWIAGATLVLFGAHAMVWGVVTVSLRQRLVPERLRGRVNSVYFLFDLGGAVLGTLLGGGPAAALGITAPFWLASGAVGLLTVATWRRFRPRRAHLLASGRP